MINLASDTVTKPTADMLLAMMQAKVGDDVFGEDPTVNALEQKVCDMFGKEAAVFCPSGTMTNQIAIKVHTQPLDELICDIDSHVYQSEAGGYAFNSAIAVNLIQGQYGKITASQIETAVKPEYDWLPKSSLVVIENSCNKGGGSYYTLDEIKPIAKACQKHNLKLHLDGARLFNVIVETNENTLDIGKYFDSISICLSKGLGAPVGSLLIGNQKDIKLARRFRKALGGGMRQAGYLAAAGIYALDHNITRLKIDNHRARQVGMLLETLPYVQSVKPVKTNIVIFDLKPDFSVPYMLKKLEALGIKAIAFGPNTIRFTFHLDISDEQMGKLLTLLPKV